MIYDIAYEERTKKRLLAGSFRYLTGKYAARSKH
jgi:hypothetical protein